MIVADKSSNPEWLAIDLLSQAEHDEDARVILVSDSQNLIKSVNNIYQNILKILKENK